MATLYDLSRQGQELYAMLEQGEIDEQTFRDCLESIGADEKLDTYCAVIRQLKADAEAVKTEVERLAAKKESYEKSVTRMKGALESFLNAIGTNRIKTALWSVSVSPTSSVKITDEAAVPAQFRTPQPDKIDKAAISRAIKDGAEVAGAVLEVSTKITIR